MTRSAQRRWRRWGWMVASGLVAATVALFAVSADARFLLRAVYEESRILARRQPLQRLVVDPTISADRRALFQLVLDVRQYAADSLGLEAGDTYTTFTDVGRDTLVLVVSASPADRLEPHTWWFPIVGRLPYHGYFTRSAALRAAADLEARGLETYVRPASAFATLGWFEDPLLSTALGTTQESVTELVIHEIAHNTVWVKNRGAFNESFALFAGYRGAELFFRSRGDSARARTTADMWRRHVRAGEVFAELVADLRDLYTAGLPREELLRRRGEVFTNIAVTVANERLPIRPPENNAMVVASLTYRTGLDVFEEAYQRLGGDLRRTIAAIAAAVTEAGDPFESVRSRVRG